MSPWSMQREWPGFISECFLACPFTYLGSKLTLPMIKQTEGEIPLVLGCDGKHITRHRHTISSFPLPQPSSPPLLPSSPSLPILHTSAPLQLMSSQECPCQMKCHCLPPFQQSTQSASVNNLLLYCFPNTCTVHINYLHSTHLAITRTW